MSEERPLRRSHKDILPPSEEKPAVDYMMQIGGSFEKNFDFYRYAAMVKDNASQRSGAGRKVLENKKLAVCVALLLKNPEVSEKTVAKTFGISYETLARAFVRASRAGKREGFVAKYASEEFLTDPSLQADKETIRHIETVAARIAMNSSVQDT